MVEATRRSRLTLYHKMMQYTTRMADNVDDLPAHLVASLGRQRGGMRRRTEMVIFYEKRVTDGGPIESTKQVEDGNDILDTDLHTRWLAYPLTYTSKAKVIRTHKRPNDIQISTCILTDLLTCWLPPCIRLACYIQENVVVQYHMSVQYSTVHYRLEDQKIYLLDCIQTYIYIYIYTVIFP